jgi:hypothetical protein
MVDSMNVEDRLNLEGHNSISVKRRNKARLEKLRRIDAHKRPTRWDKDRTIIFPESWDAVVGRLLDYWEQGHKEVS